MRKLGCTRRQIHTWESGLRVSDEALCKMAALYECSLDWLNGQPWARDVRVGPRTVSGMLRNDVAIRMAHAAPGEVVLLTPEEYKAVLGFESVWNAWSPR